MRLRDIREDSDITQKEIAEHLYIRQNTYSQYENGLKRAITNKKWLIWVFGTMRPQVQGLKNNILATFPQTTKKAYSREWAFGV